MVKLNMQWFAKDASQMSQYRKSKAITKFKMEEALKQSLSKEEKPVEEKKRTPGEAVTAVSRGEEYELYRLEHGKETPVLRDGQIAVRTGSQVVEKMEYNKRLGAWVSKSKGYKYVVRKRNR